MNLERIFHEWEANRRTNPAQAHSVIVETARGIVGADAETIKWMATNLTDEVRKLFIAALQVEATAMPEELYEPMMRAAVYEPNPMAVQAFVEPCVKAFGVARVMQTLIDYLEKGTDYEKTGAVNALHWASERKSNTESGRHKAIDPKVLSLIDYQRALYLQTFIKNPDLDLRRAIITNLDMDTFGYSALIVEQIEKVTKICRMHPDEYIKHRVEVQLRRSPSAYPLPLRKRVDAQAPAKKSWWKQIWK
jgi:hypothetical protein